MFEQQIEETIARVKENILGSKSSIHLGEIISAELPERIMKFFILESEDWLQDERKRLLNSPHFDYTDPAILDGFQEIISASKPFTIFHTDEFTKTLDKAVKLLFNYVCRPQWTLTKYLFADTDNVPVDTINALLSHFTDYAYYRVIIDEFLHKKSFYEIHRDRFEELLSLIDGEIVRSFDSRKMAQLSKPIFQLFNLDSDSEFARVPIEALTIFYDDKNISSIVERLDREKQIQSTLNIHELTMLISEVDFSLSVDISELVSQHVMGTSDIEARAQLPSDDTSFDDLPFEVETESTASLPQDRFDSEPSRDQGITFQIQDVQNDGEDIPTNDIDIESERLAGEQLTPDFADIDELEENDHDEETLPEELFLTEETTDKAAITDPAESLELSLSDDVKPSGSDDEFLQSLNLTEDDFLALKEESSALPDLIVSQKSAEGDTVSDNVHSQIVNEADSTNELDFLIAASKETISDYPVSTDPKEVMKKFGDLRELIPASDQKKYIKKIFRKNEEIFHRSIDILNGKPSWREASEHIDDIFLKNDVDMYSRIAVKFTDDIYKRYLKK